MSVVGGIACTSEVRTPPSETASAASIPDPTGARRPSEPLDPERQEGAAAITSGPTAVDLTKYEQAAGLAAAAIPKTGVPDCDRYLDQYAQCTRIRLPPDRQLVVLTNMRKQAEAWQTTPEGDVRSELADACRRARDAAKTASTGFDCDWPDADPVAEL